VQLTLTATGPRGAALGPFGSKAFTEQGGTIGRDAGNDWVLPHASVASRHARIAIAEGRFTIAPLGTARITVVRADGSPPAAGPPFLLADGDLVRLGEYTIGVAVEGRVASGMEGPSAGATPRMQPESAAPEESAPPPAAPAPSAPHAGATAAAPPRTRGLSQEPDGSGDRYTVWFGTNRRLESSGAQVRFTGERDRTVHYGWCRVSVPKSHKIGSIGSPWWKRLITRTDDRLKIVKTMLLEADAYWAQIAEGLAKTPIDDRDAVVFVHGFNVSFEEAAIRAAQLGFDLGISGLMAFYSWPSQGNVRSYTSDEATIEASEGYITDFLTAMATKSGANRVHVIAHSMGNRGLLRAIDRIAASAAARSQTPFDQIILAAPDVDYDTFRRLSVAYRQIARRTTLYVCAKDRAVEASQWIHDYARAGLVPPVTIVPGIDTINVSNLDLTLLGHGYIAEARELLTDMHTLLRHGTPPDQRFGLRAAATDEGTYWMVGG
jgi:esterase/lipase superfamily enzyme